MNPTPTTISRGLAVPATLLVATIMTGAASSIEPGHWQTVLPLVILGVGAILVFQFLALLIKGVSPLPTDFVWRFAGAFALFTAAFSLLVVALPESMWEVTKATNPLPQGIAPGVDPKLRDVVDISGPLNSVTMLVVASLLMLVAFAGNLVEDNGPEHVPSH